MLTLDISHRDSNYVQRVAYELIKVGWNIRAIPAKGKLKRNHQLIEFRLPSTATRVRLSVFSVGDRGESHRRDERRIQITTTYLSGLKRLPDYKDVVLGYDSENDVYVGLDARRLGFGGKKHNASSSVYATALEKTPRDQIRIRPHETKILGLEHQAIFKPERLAEYVFNADSIHKGIYNATGWFSGREKTTLRPVSGLAVPLEHARGEVLVLARSRISQKHLRAKESTILAYENGNWDSLRDTTPEELEEIRRKCTEVGDRGESFVLKHEKLRLRKAGKHELARKVEWTSRYAVAKGYDIKSFELDGSPRYIEVKSTSGNSLTFAMSDSEWKVAAREKSAYYIFRVVDARTYPVIERIVQNPLDAEDQRMLERIPSGWWVRLK